MQTIEATVTEYSDELVFQHGKDLLCSEIDDELVIILDDDEVSLLGLNSTANWIWQRLDGLKTLGMIIGELVNTYEVTNETGREEMNKFISALIAHKLLQESNSKC